MEQELIDSIKRDSLSGTEVWRRWENEADKVFYVIDKESGYKTIERAKDEFEAIFKRFSGTNVICDKEDINDIKTKGNEVVLDNLQFEYGYRQTYSLIDLDKIDCHKETPQELFNRKKATDYCKSISDDVIATDSVYVKFGNGYGEEDSWFINAYIRANIVSNGKAEEYIKGKIGAEASRFIEEYHRYHISVAREEWIEWKMDLQRAEDFAKRYASIFEDSLNHEFWFECNYSGRNSLEIMKAKKAAEVAVGSYNEFSAISFKMLIDYLQETASYRVFNKGNPNCYNNDFDISLGREGSMCVYIKIIYNDGYSKEWREGREKHLREDFREDEFSIVSERKVCDWTWVTYRLWWD